MALDATDTAGESEFARLVQELEDLEQQRTGSGGFASPEQAGRQLRVERQLIAALCVEVRPEDRRVHVRVPCDLWVKIQLAQHERRALITDIGFGGAFVACDDTPRPGESVVATIERQPHTLEGDLRVAGRVAWTTESGPGGRKGFGVVFVRKQDDEAAERRLRRFVLKLLRGRVSDF